MTPIIPKGAPVNRLGDDLRSNARQTREHDEMNRKLNKYRMWK